MGLFSQLTYRDPCDPSRQNEFLILNKKCGQLYDKFNHLPAKLSGFRLTPAIVTEFLANNSVASSK